MARAFVLGLLLAVTVSAAPGQSPVGSWDVVLGGKTQRGVARITFLDDGTLEGIAVFTINGNRLIHTNGGFAFRHILGSADVQGGWVRDGSNRITGYLNLVGEGEDEEVVMHGFSLSGKPRPTRLQLLIQGPSGRMTLRGIPLTETNLVELAGVNYLGQARLRKVPFPLVEIFTPTVVEPNFYDIVGNGPGYVYVGTLLISNQRYAAFFQDRSEEVLGPRAVAYAGPFNPSRRRGTLTGTDGLNTGIRYRFEPGAP